MASSQQPPQPARCSPPETESGPRVAVARRDEALTGGAVERALAVRGLGEIKLLDEDLDLQADELVIRVEGARDGLIVKGRVQIAGSIVRAVHLDDSLRQFP